MELQYPVTFLSSFRITNLMKGNPMDRNPKGGASAPAPAATKATPKTEKERLEELETLVLQGAETIQNVDLAVKEIERENKAMHTRLREILEEEQPKRPWNWKRITWAVLSSASGLALAFWLRKKQPILNHAASASLGMMAFDRIKPLKGFKPLGGAVTGLGSRWAHDNFEPLSIGMAGATYAYAGFKLGEESAAAFKDGFSDRIKALKARLHRSKEVVETEPTETEQAEEEGHASE